MRVCFVIMQYACVMCVCALPSLHTAGLERLADEQRTRLQQQLRQACLLLGLHVSHTFLSDSPPPPAPETHRATLRGDAPQKPRTP